MTRRVAVIGAGTIGAGWAAIFLACGFEVAATDPAAGAEDFARHFINNAWPTLQKLGLVVPGASAQRTSRMEPHSLPNRIQLSAATHWHLHRHFRLDPHGTIEIKGKGPMETYFLLGRADEVVA